MARIGVSSSGHVWVSKMVSGGIIGCLGFIFAIIGILGIAALIYSLT